MSANKLTLAQYRDKYRILFGAMPDGSKIEVLSVKTTPENYQELLSRPEFYRSLDNLYGNRWKVLHDSITGTDSLFVFSYRENG